MSAAGLVLAIDTATSRAGVAVAKIPAAGVDATALATLSVNHDRRHVEVLVPACEHVLGLVGAAWSDVAAIVVGVGPGMFTGLRVGLGTAKALASALRVGLVPVSSLEAMAACVAPVVDGRAVAVALDARRGEVYLQVWAPDGAVVFEAAAIEPAAMTAALAAHDRPLVVGDGARRYASWLPAGAVLGPARFDLPDIESVLVVGAARLVSQGSTAPVEVRPSYLRDADVRLGFPTLAGERAAAAAVAAAAADASPR